MFGERALKTPLFGIGHAPDGVLEMERAVCQLTYDERSVLVQRYQRRLSHRKLAVFLGCSVWETGRRIREAEESVHIELERVYGLSGTPVHI